jgi:cell fate regulator YaaT (PSP1 superfamily)
MVIVKVDRGIDYGIIVTGEYPPSAQKTNETVKEIVRIATPEDCKIIDENKAKAASASATCQQKIDEHKLDMKLVNTEYSFDRGKIIFYFTAEGRVDFRKLLKDLAGIFKTRIELRQIGVRDEAKFFSGIGPCGRKLCCASFLRDFNPVTIKMAKDQGLPLNPPKISGICGRLMCCLGYECQLYRDLLKELPKEGEKINTPEGKGKVISINPLKRTVVIELTPERRIELKL